MVIEAKHLLLNNISLGLVIQFCWIPAHYRIYDNEIADKLAKKALELDQTDIQVQLGKGHTISLIKSEVMLRWQDEWESENSARYYHRNQSSVGGKIIT